MQKSLLLWKALDSYLLQAILGLYIPSDLEYCVIKHAFAKVGIWLCVVLTSLNVYLFLLQLYYKLHFGRFPHP